MAAIELEIHIARPPEEVFEVFVDIPRSPDHVQAITRVEMLTSGPVVPGTRWKETRSMYGREETLELEISELVRPDHYVVQADAHGTRYVTRFDFTPSGEGTQVKLSFDATPRTALAKLMGVLTKMMLRSFSRSMQKDLEDLKAAVERGAE